MVQSIPVPTRPPAIPMKSLMGHAAAIQMTGALKEPLDVDKWESKMASGSACPLTNIVILFHDKPSADPIKVAVPNASTSALHLPSGQNFNRKRKIP